MEVTPVVTKQKPSKKKVNQKTVKKDDTSSSESDDEDNMKVKVIQKVCGIVSMSLFIIPCVCYYLYFDPYFVNIHRLERKFSHQARRRSECGHV